MRRDAAGFTPEVAALAWQAARLHHGWMAGLQHAALLLPKLPQNL
jgi:hypothetical protein